MKFGRHDHTQLRLLNVDITSMIDVVFLLIIFFMTTAQFARVAREDIDLPIEQGEQQENLDESGVVINISQSGEIVVASETLTMEGLEALVLDEVDRTRGRDPKQLKLTIRADRQCDAAFLNQVIDRLHAIGVGAARMATEVPR